MCEEMPEAVRFWPGFDVTGPGCQIHSSTKYEDSSASVGTFSDILKKGGGGTGLPLPIPLLSL